MSKRSFDYKKKMNNKKRLHSKQVRKILMSSAVASTLVFQPFVPIIQNGQLVGFTENSASADELAEVDILTNGTFTATNTLDPYNLTLTLSGTGLADVELIDPTTVAVFYAPDLAGDLSVNQPAQVSVELLPITLNELPAVTNLLSGLTGTVTGLLDTVLGDLGVIRGLDEVNDALDALNNLDQAAIDLLEYNTAVTPSVNNADGTITVDFSEGLGNQLEGAVQELVLPLLNDLVAAVNGITLLGAPIGETLLEPLLTPVNDVINGIVNGSTDLLSGLASAQILGETTVTVNATVDTDTDATGEIPISAAAVRTSVIDATLLSTLEAADTTDTVTLPAIEDTIAPEAPVVNPVTSEATVVTGTAEPGSIIRVSLSDGEIGESTTNEEGMFSVPISEDVDLVGGEALAVTATDSDGNESDPATVIVTDVTAPDIPVLDEVTTDSTAVTGTAEPNSQVLVTLPDGETRTGTTDAEGVFSAPLLGDTDLAGGERITAVAIDAAGNTSDPAVTIVVDLEDETAPPAPDVNEVTSEDTEVTGTAEPNSTITVTFPTGEIAEDLTSNEGTFTVALPEGVDLVGGEELIVVATDGSGNPSAPTTVTVGDETAPEAPTVDEIGDSATEVTGEAEAGSEITITLPDGETATGTTEEDGSFSVPLPAGTELSAGDELEVIATDEAGNASDPTTVTVTDTTAPILSPIDDATVIEGLSIDPIEVEVNESGIDLSGLPEGLVYDDETGLITGTLSIDDWDVTEEERDLDVSVTAIDEAGNESEAEEFVLTVQRDTDGDGIPDIEDNDDDNDGVSDDDEEASETNPKDETDVPDDIDPDITAPVITEIDDITVVEGEEIEEIEVETDDEDSVVTVEGLPNGLSFDEATDTISGAPTIEDWGTTEEERDVDVSVTAMDHSGNESEAEVFTITIQRDTDGDGTPDVEDEDDDNDGFTDEEEIEAGSDPKDDTSIPDVVAPDTPIVNDVTSEDTTVDGTAEPGSEIIVTLPNGETVNGVTDEDGNFSVTLPEDLDLTGGEVLEIVARDEAGNVSDPEFIRVIDRTAPIILEIEDQRIVEGTEIENVNIVVENPGEENQEPDLAAQGFANFALRPFATPLEGVFVQNLPEGTTFDAEENVISGVPVISDWGETEEERDLDVTVIARDEAGNEATETFIITVLRDTDGDGIPDIDDEDDDNDGATDEEEIDAGTDPKDDTDVPEDGEEADTTAPEAPTVEPVTDESTEVVGEAEPNTDVTITLPNGDTITGRTDEDGNFVIALPEDLELEVGDELVIVVTDEAGNSSEPLVVVVTDGSTSETPTDPDEDGNTPGEDQDGTPTDGNNGAGGNDPSTGGGQSDDTAGGKDQESLPQTGESQSMLAVMSGSVMAAISTMMLAWNKRKKGFTKRK